MVRHPLDLFLWGVELMAGSAAIQAPKRRQVQMRDGLLIAAEALRGHGLLSLPHLKLGDDIGWGPRVGWRIKLSPGRLADEEYVAANLFRILDPWLDRYMRRERQELLGAGRCSSLWITWSGDPLGEIGFEQRVRWWSMAWSGGSGAFGAFEFRSCVQSHAPLLNPQDPDLAVILLRICHGAAGAPMPMRTI